jgi:hypothetical protein
LDFKPTPKSSTKVSKKNKSKENKRTYMNHVEGERALNEAVVTCAESPLAFV